MLIRPRSRFRSAAGLRAWGVASCAALVLTGAGCTRIGRPPTTTSPPANITLDNVSYVAMGQQAKAAGQTPWWCKSEGLGGSMDHGHSGGLANNYYAGKVKGTLSAADCDALSRMFDEIIPKVRKYKTRGDAKQSGSAQLVQFVEGMGTHDSVRGGTSVGLPPGPPMFLQYDGEADTAPLAGMSWFTFTSGPPPAGFPGDNDWWHSHTTLCYTAAGEVKGNEISDEECRAKGGFNLRLPGVWMAHAWIVPGYEDKFDVFSGAYMCVKGEGKPPAPNDPCHDDHSDPEHGGMDHGTTPTTDGHGHTDADHANMTTTTTRGLPTTTRRVTPTTRAVTTTTMGSMPGMDHGDHAH